MAVQEFGARGDLFSFFRRRPGGRLSHHVAGVAVVRPLLEALAYMHGVGICHRDIKVRAALPYWAARPARHARLHSHACHCVRQ